MPDELPRRAEDFYRLLENLRGAFVDEIETAGAALAALLASRARILGGLDEAASSALSQDVGCQLDHLFYRGSLAQAAPHTVTRLPRYLLAIETRIRKARESPERERQRAADYAPHWQKLLGWLQDRSAAALAEPPVQELRFALEELRVSVFAQEIKTSGPVSPKRIARMWEKLE